jgi:hypothetical protein
LSIDAGASWCRVLLLLTVPSGVIVCLERSQHFGDVDNRKTNSRLLSSILAFIMI